jgi:predicted metal-dependent phosphoesterase TrpH
MKQLDLHIHTTASDGVYSPSEVVRIALERGLDVIALTDHDSTDGLPEAWEAARNTSLEVIAGVEFGCEDETRQIDILGYLMDINNPVLQNTFREMRTFRERRAELILDRLVKLGINLSLERVRAVAGHGVITRPHIAQVMVEQQIVPGLQAAFDRYIDKGGPAYVARYKLPPPKAVELIHQAGGVAVVAHPGRYKTPLKIVEEFVRYGVDGVEVFYPDHALELRQQLLQIAARYDLLVTGGSDFHRPEGDGFLRLGCEAGAIPVNTVERLRERANGWKSRES